MASSIIGRVKRLTKWQLLTVSVLTSIILSCTLSGVMSLIFKGYVAHDYIITGVVTSFIVATFIVYIILALTKEIKAGSRILSEKDHQLQIATSEVVKLKGLLPICNNCKKIRDDDGNWNELKSYVEEFSKEPFRYRICPECSKFDEDRKKESNEICPVSNLPILNRTDWSMGNSSTPYRVRFSILGDRILYSCPSGFAKAKITRKSVQLAKKVEDYIHQSHQSYVQIENFEKLSGFTINARLTYINHFKTSRTGIRCLIFFGVPYLTALSIRIAVKLYRFKFPVKVVNSYEEAVNLATHLASMLEHGKQDSSKIKSYLKVNIEDISDPIIAQTESDPSWVIETKEYKAEYEILNGNIIHCKAKGFFKNDQIPHMIHIQKRLYERLGSHFQDCHIIADVTDVSVEDYNTRLNYINAQNTFYKKYPFQSLSFYGISKKMRAAINLGRPFLKFQFYTGKNLGQILQRIHSKVPTVGGEGNLLLENPGKYVDDILEYIATINPEIEMPGLPAQKVQETHPFRPVFDAIDLIKRDLDQIEIDRQKEEEQRLAIEKRLSDSQKMEALGTLSGGIAHDFNNILSGIFGYSQLMNSHINDPVKVSDYNHKIIKAAQRAASLIQQILSFSRQSEYKKQPVSLSNIVFEVLALIRSTIPSNIQIQENLNTNAKILANSTQIHQVIMNLCTNAYHAIGNKSGKLIIKLEELELSSVPIEAERNSFPGRFLKLTVSDTGSGIEKGIREKIFDPYFTTKEIGSGTGLGLAVVKGIIKDHNGFIEFKTQMGVGTTFEIYFPITSDNDSNSVKSDSVCDEPARGSESIMVVDDEPSILETLTSTLSENGYKVSSFSDGKSALKSFFETPDRFDLIISDMSMPKMTGDKLSKEILKIRPKTPIIICTGYYERFSEKDAIASGIMKYIQKPVVGSELLNIIRELIDNKETKK